MAPDWRASLPSIPLLQILIGVGIIVVVAPLFWDGEDCRVLVVRSLSKEAHQIELLKGGGGGGAVKRKTIR